LLDDHNDKDMQRNQIIAMVVMLVFIGVWTYFFLPRGQQPQPAAPAPVEQQQAQQSPDSPAAAQTPATAATPDSPSGSTELPPVATEFQEGDDVILRNEALELTFTRVGARLKQARVLLGKEEVDSVELVPQQSYERLEDLDLPLGLRFASNYLGESLNYRRWDASVSPAGDAITFSINVPGQASIEKVFRVDGATHVLTSEVRYTNTGAEPRVLGLDTKEPAVSLVWQPQVLKAAGDAGNMMPQKIIWHVQGINERTATSTATPNGQPSAAPTSSWRSSRNFPAATSGCPASRITSRSARPCLARKWPRASPSRAPSPSTSAPTRRATSRKHGPPCPPRRRSSKCSASWTASPSCCCPS
jgi:hypothetical protein